MIQWDCHVYPLIVSDSQITFPGDLGIFFDLESTFTSESSRRYGAITRKDRAE